MASTVSGAACSQSPRPNRANPKVRVARSVSRLSSPKISDSRPLDVLRNSSICHSRSCA